MTPIATRDGKYVIASFLPTKQKFRTTHTKGHHAAEAQDVNDLVGVVKYCSIESAARALRKTRTKK